VSSAPLALSSIEAITLKIWDFGGQDIYHGTHALFPVIWTPESEVAREHSMAASRSATSRSATGSPMSGPSAGRTRRCW
jgi:hypothetical protein